MTEEVKEGSTEAMIFDLHADIERLLTDRYDERDKLRAEIERLQATIKCLLDKEQAFAKARRALEPKS